MCQFVKRNENKAGEIKKKTIKLRRHCICLGNITPWNGHMLTDSGQSVETLWSNRHIWSLILQELGKKRGKRSPSLSSYASSYQSKYTNPILFLEKWTEMYRCLIPSWSNSAVCPWPPLQIFSNLLETICIRCICVRWWCYLGGASSRDCQRAAESLVPWQRAASSQPVSSSAKQSSLSVCGRLALMYFANAPFLTLCPY